MSLLSKVINGIGIFCAFLLILLMLIITFNVISRYVFNDVSIGMQELEWHLFGAIFMLGMGYAYAKDEHVRVDVLYEKMPQKYKSIINILGTIIFMFPFSILVTYLSFHYVHESYSMNESSGDPGGLAYRWIIKSIIPISFIYLILSGIDFMHREYIKLKKVNS